MDARIGKLVREGKEVFYAIINGETVEGPLEYVEQVLGLRKPMTTAQARKLAEAAGLACAFFKQGGGYWKATNPETGARIIFDTLYCKSYGHRDIAAKIASIA